MKTVRYQDRYKKDYIGKPPVTGRISIEQHMARVAREEPEEEKVGRPEQVKCTVMRICAREGCNIEFKKKRKNQKYCCHECTPRGQRTIKAKARSEEAKICLHCGATFYSKANNVKFCPSKKCSQQYHWLHCDPLNKNKKGK